MDCRPGFATQARRRHSPSGVGRCPRPVSRQGEEISMARYPAVAVLLVVVALAFGGGGAAASPGPDLGPNVIVFDTSMSTSEIQAKVDAIAAQQVSNEFGTQ